MIFIGVLFVYALILILFRLDYTGITLLIVGSFIPFLYYAFYCRPLALITYTSVICILGIAAVIVSLWDKFAEPRFRPVRASVFVAMGLSSKSFRLFLLYNLSLFLVLFIATPLFNAF